MWFCAVLKRSLKTVQKVKLIVLAWVVGSLILESSKMRSRHFDYYLCTCLHDYIICSGIGHYISRRGGDGGIKKKNGRKYLFAYLETIKPCNKSDFKPKPVG